MRTIKLKKSEIETKKKIKLEPKDKLKPKPNEALNIELKIDYFIESARFLSQLPASHPCAQMHGHSFKVIFCFRGPIDPKIGWLEDYNVLEKKIKPILKLIDHKVLNEVQGLENPTTELLCVWLYNKVKKKVSFLHQVTVKETHNTECSYPC